MFAQLMKLMRRPALYEKGTIELWTDEHISKGMLQAHLDSEWDAATRNHAAVKKSVGWIASVAPAQKYPDLLDLGCGPGIYAEEFHSAGYRVSGMDFSERSIGYARNSAREKHMPITYHHSDYLTLDFSGQFDLITLIYYDFGVLSAEDRARLLVRIHSALRSGGLLIFDVLTPRHFDGIKESKSWEYADKSFYCAEPHVCLHSFHRYDEQSTTMQQAVIITEGSVRHINIWQHTFTREEICGDLAGAGFAVRGLYGSIEGDEYSDDGKAMCIVAQVIK